MIFRKAYQLFVDTLEVKQIIAITGLRRVGKTTAVKYLLSRIKSNNKLYLDLERIEFRRIFQIENYGEIIKALEIEGLDFKKKAWLALDEIQLVPNITSVLKYIYDTYDLKIIVTGSSSFYMKGTFSESLAGRKRLFELWPLGFDDFLSFKNERLVFPEEGFTSTNPHFIQKYRSLYEEFVNFGGLPEVALTDKTENKRALLSDIYNSYINLDIKFLADFKKADELAKLISLLSSRVGSRMDYSKLSVISGINRIKIKEYLQFLESTFFIKLIKPFVKNRDREIALQHKLYFSDNGLLGLIGTVSSGALFENAIANQLYMKGDLRFYLKRTGQEIDFILNQNMAFEVKETPTPQDLKVLKNRSENLGVQNFVLVGRELPLAGFNEFVWGGAISSNLCNFTKN